jgi:hypothetical protein
VQEDAEGVNVTVTAWQMRINCRIDISANVIMNWHFSSGSVKIISQVGLLSHFDNDIQIQLSPHFTFFVLRN